MFVRRRVAIMTRRELKMVLDVRVLIEEGGDVESFG